MLTYILLEILGWVMIFVVIVILAVHFSFFSWLVRKIKNKKALLLGLILAVGLLALYFGHYQYPLHFAMPPMMHSYTPDHNPPSLPLNNLFHFFTNSGDFEQVSDIGRDPNDVPTPIDRTTNETLEINIVAKEVIGEVYPRIYNNYWTFNGKAPGELYRARVGDTIVVNLSNANSSLHPHNIDFHATTGPGGGATISNVKPGEIASFQWKALAPGLYVYHCATSNVSVHNSHGQYGMILIEPEEGLPPVDKEFYVMQGELYTTGGLGKKGLQAFDPQALLDGIPTYITFNGKIESETRMHAKVGDKIRIYIGNGGVNLISSFHVIGEIFDKVYPEGSIGTNSPIFKNVQTTAVLPGGSSIVEFTVDVPGKYLLVDHALARMNKGAWAVLEVKGEDQPEIFKSLTPSNGVIH